MEKTIKMNIVIFKIKIKIYYKNDYKIYNYHNSYGYSYFRNEDNNKFYKEYCINNLLHNELGPAVIQSNKKDSYYLNGKKLSFIQWNENIKHTTE